MSTASPNFSGGSTTARGRHPAQYRKETTMKPKSKAELLEHYATREPKAFHQFDGFLEQWGDSVSCDEDGHGLYGPSLSWELMRGSGDRGGVRVLIPVGTSSADAVKLLRKIIYIIKGWGPLDHKSISAEEEALIRSARFT
jgi:hypothetical protein